jgi:hypothetical protein
VGIAILGLRCVGTVASAGLPRAGDITGRARYGLVLDQTHDGAHAATNCIPEG